MVLDEKITGQAAARLKQGLLAKRGQPLHIDAGNVIGIDTQGFEVLLAAAKLWRADQVALAYTMISEPMQRGLEILGLSRADLEAAMREQGEMQ